ncbi:MAG: choice-of-anchor tandem repeat GloVer-containing protein, partial [Verrucomicrobiia bacterium]
MKPVTMKILRIALVIVLVVVAGRGFNAGAQTETILHSFVGPAADGATPWAGLVQGSDSNFYGTTVLPGTVFRISPGGSETILYSFKGFPTDGQWPYAGLVQGSDGNFYGTTASGGTNDEGTVFRISPSGNETNLYSFGSLANDGSFPVAGLVQGSDGNFYGTTKYGGLNGWGTVFRISASGSYTNLYSFGSHANDGEFPEAGLVQGSDGNFYGTAWEGGGTNTYCPYGCGTV